MTPYERFAARFIDEMPHPEGMIMFFLLLFLKYLWCGEEGFQTIEDEPNVTEVIQ